ncbi:hypothetical protein [Corynebacterium variabile]|uniref:hypothetical protein n=1 Tax=Corynebacterium variabile TaxID=1727 RepID=UPI0028B1C0BB|nr:hypothetical protein [Corynebacterium variabile]
MHETPLPRLSRRRFLTRTLLVGLGVTALPAAGALTACSPDQPEPDERMLEILGALRALDGSPAAPGSFFSTQADRVSAEVVRQCGTDPSDSCTASVGNVPTPAEKPSVASVRGMMTALLPEAADKDQAALLAGLFAAQATVADKDAGTPAVDWAVVDGPLSGSTPTELEDATSRIHEAIWLTGRILPTAGSSTSAVDTVGTRLRRVRDALVTATGIPASAGYTFPSGAPSGADAVSVLHDAVHGVTVDLRRSVRTVSSEDRVTVAMWCAVSARCEAALEDALGEDPFAVAVRGE